MSEAPEKLYYKIGEVCEICQIEPHVLRYWESEFSALAPSKNKAGQRTYSQKDIELVETIKRLLYDEGYTIAGANKRLSHRRLSAATHDQEILSQVTEELQDLITLLETDPS
ncbi:MAG TPA: MerR family transcriptional regulator [Acidobacteriota bacterium]|nr:MerR family transcriptional regulator [Acidobacteriota bacterium]